VRETDAVHMIFRGGHLHGRDRKEMTTTLPVCRDDEAPLWSAEIACFSPFYVLRDVAMYSTLC
jgi:hypothetical protein